MKQEDLESGIIIAVRKLIIEVIEIQQRILAAIHHGPHSPNLFSVFEVFRSWQHSYEAGAIMPRDQMSKTGAKEWSHLLKIPEQGWL